jgi:4'-phosphopantetheinyl transferase
MDLRSLDSLPDIRTAGGCALGPGEVHLWYVLYESIQDPRLLAGYQALMSEAERERHDRFVFARDRHQFLVTRALVRTTLSRYAPIAPADWRFVCNEYGKPRIEPGQGHESDTWPRLSFNLSNTRGVIACALTADCDEIGVDVEDTSRAGETIEIADRFFSPVEVEALRALPAAHQRQRFFAYWTLKEAYIKARGMGLSIPLDQFSFHLEGDEDIGISFDPRLGDDPGQWQFELYRASERHLMALALRRGGGMDSPRGGAAQTVRAASCVPLA